MSDEDKEIRAYQGILHELKKELQLVCEWLDDDRKVSHCAAVFKLRNILRDLKDIPLDRLLKEK